MDRLSLRDMLVMMEGVKMRRADEWARSARLEARLMALAGEKHVKVSRLMPEGLLDEPEKKSALSGFMADWDKIATKVQ